MSYPIIYSERETKFDAQGLGVLSDAISCVVTEERNSSYELEMVYPLIGIHYDEIKLDRIICAVPAQKKEPQPFRIYKITRPLNGKVTVDARHISYQLSYIPVEPFTAANCAEALQGLKIHSKEDNPFTFYTDIDKVADYKQFTPKSLRSRLMGNDGCINDVYGEGDYEFDKYTVKYLADRGKDNGLVIKYGSNLTDLEQEENIENCITGILPYWEANNFGSMKVEMLPERVIETKNADKYPFHRTVPHSFADKFYEEPKEEELRKVANEYIEKELVGVPDVSLDISFIDLADTDEFKDMSSKVINLCDTVTVQFEKLGVDAKAKVVRTEYDVLADRYNSIKVSSTNASSSLSDTISELTKKITAAPTQGFLEAAIQHATQLINGGLGGHIVINNSNGYPSEILIMDTDNVSTAKNVFRLNMNGWGLSTTGIDGPYTTACTIDGNFNASIINSGEINCNLLNGGVIKGQVIQGGTITGTTMKTTKLTFGDADNSVTVQDAAGSTKHKAGIMLGGAGEIFLNTDIIKYINYTLPDNYYTMLSAYDTTQFFANSPADPHSGSAHIGITAHSPTYYEGGMVCIDKNYLCASEITGGINTTNPEYSDITLHLKANDQTVGFELKGGTTARLYVGNTAVSSQVNRLYINTEYSMLYAPAGKQRFEADDDKIGITQSSNDKKTWRYIFWATYADGGFHISDWNANSQIWSDGSEMYIKAKDTNNNYSSYRVRWVWLDNHWVLCAN